MEFQGLDEDEQEFFTIQSMDLEPVKVTVDISKFSEKLAGILEDCVTPDDYIIETVFSKEVIEYAVEFCQLVNYDTISNENIRKILQPCINMPSLNDIIPHHILKKLREIRKKQLEKIQQTIDADEVLSDQCRIFKRVTLFLEDFLMTNAMQWVVLYVSWICIDNKYSPEIFLTMNPLPSHFDQWKKKMKFSRTSFIEVLVQVISELHTDIKQAIELAKNNRKVYKTFNHRMLKHLSTSTIRTRTRALCRHLDVTEEEFSEHLYLDFQRVLKYYVKPWWFTIIRSNDILCHLNAV